MAKAKIESTGLVRRNTAVATTALIDIPAASLLDEQAPAGARVMSLDMASPEDQELLFKTEGGLVRDAMAHVAEPFPVRHWIAKAVDVAQEGEAEPVRCVRLTLISPEGEMLALTSIGAVQSWDLIRNFKGDGPYDPPIDVWCQSVKTRKGFNMWRLTPFAPKKS